MKKTKAKRGIAIVSFVVGVLGMLCPSIQVDGRATYASADELEMAQTYVVDDLSGMTVEGAPFKLSSWNYDLTKDANVLTFAEYCYSYDPARQGNYNLYFYVYNPKGLYFDNSERDSVSLRFNTFGNYEKYPIELLSVCREANYERMFLKYGIQLTAGDKTAILSGLSSSSRTYEVGEVELYEVGAAGPTAYGVGHKWTFSGYASGYGPNAEADNMLNIVSEGGEVVTLDVHPTQYRPDGSNGKTEFTQDTLHSVYFAIPKEKVAEYGRLTAVHAQWYDALLKPGLVTGDQEAYEFTYSQIGVPQSERTGHEYSYFGGLGDIDEYLFGPNSVQLCFVDDTAFTYGNFADYMSGVYYHYSTEYGVGGNDLDTVYTGLPTDDFAENSADFYTVGGEELQASASAHKDAFGGELVNEKYSKAMFEWVNEEVTDKVISSGQLYSLTEEKISQNWWDRLWYGANAKSVKTFDGIPAIEALDGEKMSGTADEVSRRLCVSLADLPALQAFYGEHLQDNVIYILRYKTSETVAQEATILKTNDEPLYLCKYDNCGTNAYFFQTEVELDFDVIDVELSTPEKATILAVAMDPVDIFPSVTPPINVTPDASLPWWAWVLVGVAALLVLVFLKQIIEVIVWLFKIVFWLLGLAFKVVWWIVSAPFKFIIWLVKSIRGDYD